MDKIKAIGLIANSLYVSDEDRLQAIKLVCLGADVDRVFSEIVGISTARSNLQRFAVSNLKQG